MFSPFQTLSCYIIQTHKSNSLLWLIQQQLTIHHLIQLHTRNSLTHLQCRSRHVQLSLIHQVTYRKSRTYRLTILAIQQHLTLSHQLVNLLINQVEVYHHRNVFVNRPVVKTRVSIFKLSNLILLIVVNKVNQTYYPQISELLLTV